MIDKVRFVRTTCPAFEYLTPGRVYEATHDVCDGKITPGLLWIKGDNGGLCLIKAPGHGECSHLMGGEWEWADE